MDGYNEPLSDSEITGSVFPDSGASSATGAPPGGTGFGEIAKAVTDRLQEGEGPNGRSSRKWRRLPESSTTKPELRELSAIRVAMEGAGRKAVYAILLHLASVTVMADNTAPKPMLKFYAQELADIPADILEAACTEWARKRKFFPALCELLELAEPLCEARQNEAWALHRYLGMTADELRDAWRATSDRGKRQAIEAVARHKALPFHSAPTA